MAIQVNYGSWTYPTFVGYNSEIYHINPDSGMEKVLAGGGTARDCCFIGRPGKWLTLQGPRDDANAEVYIWSSFSDISDTTNALNSWTGYQVGREYSTIPIVDNNNGRRGWLWGEYQTDNQSQSRILFVDADADSISTELSVADSEIRHFHSVDHDPYNPGTLYATTGDVDDEIRWYKSTDYGQTWSIIERNDYTYKTLRLNFGKDYIYWGTDAFVPNPDGDSGMFRAPRNDTANPERIGTPDNPRSHFIYGSCLLEEPRGVLFGSRKVSTRNDADSGPDEASLYFWDIRAEEMHRLHTFKLQNTTSGGIRDISPYRDSVHGVAYLEVTDYDNHRISSGAGGNIDNSKQVFEVDVTQAMR